MNPLQMAMQVRHLLRTVAWVDGSAEVVFGTRGVILHAGVPPADDAIPEGFPFAMVLLDTASMDEDHPDLISQDLSVVTVVEVAGDPTGEFAVRGGARADLGKSAGAGIAEVMERVRAALQELTGADGAKVLVSASGAGSPAVLGRGRHLAHEELTLRALCTSQPQFAEPQQVANSGSSWTWLGPHCSGRYDFLQYRLGYVAGSTPASDPASATIVYTGTAAAATHAPSAGRAYSVWADYDPRGTGSVAHSSDGSLVGAYLTT